MKAQDRGNAAARPEAKIIGSREEWVTNYQSASSPVLMKIACQCSMFKAPKGFGGTKKLQAKRSKAGKGDVLRSDYGGAMVPA